MELEFDVYAKIARPVAEVFEAVTDPAQLSAYFTTGGSSGPLREGSRMLWKFGDAPGEYPVQVTRIVPNKRIEFTWDAGADTYQTQVVMTFEALDAGNTLVRLKAHLEHGINLRRGFF